MRAWTSVSKHVQRELITYIHSAPVSSSLITENISERTMDLHGTDTSSCSEVALSQLMIQRLATSCFLSVTWNSDTSVLGQCKWMDLSHRHILIMYSKIHVFSNDSSFTEKLSFIQTVILHVGPNGPFLLIFRRTLLRLRYVGLILSQIRLSSVCLLSVCLWRLVTFYSEIWTFRQYFALRDSSSLR